MPRTPQLPKLSPRAVLVLTLAVGLGLPTVLFAAVLVLSPVTKPLMVDWLVRTVVGADPAVWPYTRLVYGLVIGVLAFVLINFGAIISGMTVWWEMRVSSRMQSRVGYNRAGAGGFFQWVADAVKLLFKEDLIPAEADSVLFRAAPYFVMTGFALTFVALPFGESLIAADLNVGIFYLTAVTALVVVGILLAGWSSNSKWALFGGMRSAAQVVSYEIPAGIALMVPVAMAGTLSMQGIIAAQGAWPWQWNAFTNPAGGGGLRHLLRLPARRGQPHPLRPARGRVGAGGRLPLRVLGLPLRPLLPRRVRQPLGHGRGDHHPLPRRLAGALRGPGGLRRRQGRPAPSRRLAWWGLQVLSMVVMATKTLMVLNVIVWVRWTLPRMRVDQMMNLCWKYLVPWAFVAFLFTLLWQLAGGPRPRAADRAPGWSSPAPSWSPWPSSSAR